MDSDNTNNKVVWKRGGQNDTTPQVPSQDNSKSSSDTDIPVMDMSAQNASYSSKTNDTAQDIHSEITSLKDEINQVLSGEMNIAKEDAITQPIDTSEAVDLDAPATDILADASISTDDLPRTPKAHPVENNTNISDFSEVNPEQGVLDSPESSNMDTLVTDNHEALVASLKQDIESDLQQEEVASTRKNTGVGQTYYSDLTKAMGSNEPATMSELIRKSRFEEKEAKILSPKSRKNIAFIVGSIILLLVSIGILSTVFKPKEEVEFITEQRVDSLVYSNLDTGINTTGLEATRIKQAIRDVIEMEIPNDAINQIYYVENDGLGNLRRLGVKDIFSKTNNETPEILYDNIENNFTHGVYHTDKNYPFVILKALSYDRALEGLKEWEPTMIDDLATYMDLPPEATDRSLLKPGFEDDLIRNKNVRVARFLPREVDQRGILDFLTGNNSPNETESSSDTTTINQTNENETGEETLTPTISFLERAKEITAQFFDTPVYAQTTYSVSGTVSDSFGPLPDANVSILGTTLGSATNDQGYYSIDNIPTGTQELQYSYLGYQTQTRTVSNATTNLNVVLQEEATGLDEVVITTGSSNSNNTTTTTNNTSNGEDSWSFGNTNSGPQITSGINTTLDVDTTPVCFNQLTGERIQSSTPEDQQYGFCFKPYVCYRYTCYVGNQDIGPNGQGQPGAVCGEDRAGGTVLHTSETGYNPNIDGTVQSCYQLVDVLSIQNISKSKLCFDKNTGQYLPGTISESVDVVCTVPAQEETVMCIGENGGLEQPGQSVGQLCFQPFQRTVTGGLSSTDGCQDLTYDQVRQKVGAIAYELRRLSYYASILGLSNEDVSNLRQAAEFLESVARGGTIQSEAYTQAYQVVQLLEHVLETIDRTHILPALGSAGQSVYEYLNSIVYELKCVFGVETTIGWNDITLPQGETIFTGQSSPTVNAVQEALTIIGIMDAGSPHGTLDLVTQDAIAQFQTANGLEVTGIIDPATLDVLNSMSNNQATLFGDNGTINDYFIVTSGASSSNGEQILTLGAYNQAVQNMQILLYAEGYPISTINGLFDTATCSALQEFQSDQSLDISDSFTCIPGPDTLETMNEIIGQNNYLGSGFYETNQGYLAGTGELQGTFGPGVANFEVNDAEADSLREGDVVLMYMFLDEQTILIARDEIVIDEVVKRRALSDIFQ